MSLYTWVKKYFGPLLRRCFRLTVTGAENLPADGGLVLCANHTSMLDILVLALAADRPIRYMAKKELFSPLLGRLFTALGAFPVNRGGADITAIKTTISLIEKGEMVGMFPQGTRYKYTDPSETKAKHGVGLIAWRAKCPVQPVFINTKVNCVKWFRKTEVIFGKTIPFDELGLSEGNSREYTAAAETVFSRICELDPKKSLAAAGQNDGEGKSASDAENDGEGSDAK